MGPAPPAPPAPRAFPGVGFGMKFLLLPLALVGAACQAPQRAHSVHQSVPAPAPQAAPADEAAAPALPRWNHLDRAEFAVRQWVRDRS